jgi:hypothetical protein
VAKSPLRETAAERLQRRIRERLDAEKLTAIQFRRTQRGLSKRLQIGDSAISELLTQPASTRGLLRYLDTIADYLGVPPSLLIHRNDTKMIEVGPGEYRLLTHWRNFPADIQQQIMVLFDYFGGLLPEERAQRLWWSKMRRLSAADRRLVEQTIDASLRHGKTIVAPKPGAADDETAVIERPAGGARRGRRGGTTRRTDDDAKAG